MHAVGTNSVGGGAAVVRWCGLWMANFSSRHFCFSFGGNYSTDSYVRHIALISKLISYIGGKTEFWREN